MKSLGVDIGSRTIKLVVIKEEKPIYTYITDTGYDPLNTLKQCLSVIDYDIMLATGYGRGLAEVELGAPTVTEIKAFAAGVRAIIPEARTILDIGGQDTKTISLNDKGEIIKFELNDRCAAGTGRFLEVMANALGCKIEEFGRLALQGNDSVQISSMCTVFAETEAISLLARGKRREDIARGLHNSIAVRTVAMLKRVGVKTPFVFAGGVAQNCCLHHLLEEMLSVPVIIPDNPQIIGAFGAAILAKNIK